MEFADYVRIVRNHWRLVCAAMLISGLLALGYNSLAPRVYEATSTGTVTVSVASTEPSLNNLNNTLALARAKSYVALAGQTSVAEAVIDELRLDTSATALIDDVSVAQVPDTTVLTVAARSNTSTGARDLANAWLTALADEVAAIEPRPADSNSPMMRLDVTGLAEAPVAPIAPQSSRNIVLGVMFGALLGLGLAVARSALNRRIRSEGDVRQAGERPVVGALPVLPDGGELFATDDGASDAAAEAVRRLRTNLLLMDADGAPGSIVVTSPSQGDGKTTIASSLAAAYAAAGHPVTLVDADLRQPRLAEALGVTDKAGLTDVLTGRVALPEALRSHPSIAGLSVLTAGTSSASPADALASPALQTVMDELTERGMVIIDSPPLLTVTDAAILAQASDGAVVVVSAGQSRDADLEVAVSHLDRVNARTFGVVLNRVSKRSVGAAEYAQYGFDSTSHAKAPGKRGAAGKRSQRVSLDA